MPANCFFHSRYYFNAHSTILMMPTNVVPKGGWEPSDGVLEAAASREALEEGPTLYPSSVHRPLS